jgi:hypothetical protein
LKRWSDCLGIEIHLKDWSTQSEDQYWYWKLGTSPTYVNDPGRTYQDEIRRLLIKIVQKISLEPHLKKSLVILSIITLFKNEFAIGESHQALLKSTGEKIDGKKDVFWQSNPMT